MPKPDSPKRKSDDSLVHGTEEPARGGWLGAFLRWLMPMFGGKGT